MAYCKANQLDCNGFCNRFDAPCIKKNCRFFGVKTNADRIRAMTDEELAALLSEPCECSVDPEEDDYRECGNKFCIEYLLNWLKQPAEGD